MKKLAASIIVLAVAVIFLLGLSSCYKSGPVYELNEDGKGYTLVGTEGTVHTLVIDTYKGLPVTAINDVAFINTSIQKVEIGKSVTSINDGAFSDCRSLKSITVDEDNTVYKSINGNLYTEDGKTLIRYAVGKTDTSFTIPDSVTNIGLGAFNNCGSLEFVVIPDSVTSIGNSAFYGCDGLTSVTFKDTSTWYRTGSYDNWINKTGGTQTAVTNASNIASYLSSSYDIEYWYKK